VKDYCTFHRKAHGCATTAEASRSNKLYLICDRGGVYRNHLNHTETSRVRRTTTKKIGCPFCCEAMRPEDGSWELKLIDIQHTHAPSETPTAHAVHRRFNDAEKEQILAMANRTVPTREIVSIMSENSTMITPKMINNLIYSAKRDRLAGCTAIQALLDNLKDKSYVTTIRLIN